MARSGRKRKLGARHPGGQLKKPSAHAREVDDKVRATRQPQRRALARLLKSAGRNDAEISYAVSGEEAESPLGRLWLAGLLATPSDPDSTAARNRYDAGNLFAQVVGAYRSVIEAPRSVAGSGRGYPCEPRLCALDAAGCECAKRKQRYDGAYHALAGWWRPGIGFAVSEDQPEPLRQAIAEHARLRSDAAYVPVARERRRILTTVTRVTIHREPIGTQDLVYLVAGLDVLVDHFGLTQRRHRSHYRNTQ